MQLLILHMKVDMILKDVFKAQSINYRNLLKIVQNIPLLNQKNYNHTIQN